MAKPRRELTKEERDDAGRLMAIWENECKPKGMTQMQVALDCGWKTQAAFNQYLHGKIPLNLDALIKISGALRIAPQRVSPRLAKRIGEYSDHVVNIANSDDLEQYVERMSVLAGQNMALDLSNQHQS